MRVLGWISLVVVALAFIYGLVSDGQKGLTRLIAAVLNAIAGVYIAWTLF